MAPVLPLQANSLDPEKPGVVRSSSKSRQVNDFERYIKLASVIDFGVIILASWESFALTFQFALTNGGLASIFYGSILAGLGACALGLSLAELASIDPTVGAQYRWSANFAPFAPRFWGLLQGWSTVAAWSFARGGPPSLLANMLTSMAASLGSGLTLEEDFIGQSVWQKKRQEAAVI